MNEKKYTIVDMRRCWDRAIDWMRNTDDDTPMQDAFDALVKSIEEDPEGELRPEP